MAQAGEVFHSVEAVEDLQFQLNALHVGENVQRGYDIENLYQQVMQCHKSSRRNVLSNEFCEYGMGIASGADGRKYMVQLFRSAPEENDE
jgi:uncharacterized protein YkwD